MFLGGCPGWINCRLYFLLKFLFGCVTIKMLDKFFRLTLLQCYCYLSCTSCTQKHWHHLWGTIGSKQVIVCSKSCCFLDALKWNITKHIQSLHEAGTKINDQQGQDALWPTLESSSGFPFVYVIHEADSVGRCGSSVLHLLSVHSSLNTFIES